MAISRGAKYIIDYAVSAIPSAEYARIGAILAEWRSRCFLRAFTNHLEYPLRRVRSSGAPPLLFC